jgi:hypothetical protein
MHGTSLLSIEQSSHRFHIDNNVTVEVEYNVSHIQSTKPASAHEPARFV